jgi:diamine N-acetyltransferase
VASDPALPVVNLVGEKVALGPFGADQFATFNRWENDPVVARNLGSLPRPRTLATTSASFAHGVWSEATSDVFALYERATWRLIGYTGLMHIDHINQTAEFLIVIGEADARGRGYGTEATSLVLDYAFVALGLSNIILRVSEYNRAGIRAYEKAGFRIMGVRRKSKLMGGRRWDTIYMQIVAEDFESPVLAQLLTSDQPRQ